MRSSRGRHGGNQGRTDKHEAEQARHHGLAESMAGARDADETEGHTAGKE